MRTRILAQILLVSFVATAAFSLYLPSMEHVGHGGGCPFAPGSTDQCVTLLEHVDHWQTSFAATLAEIVFILSLLGAVLVLWFMPSIRDPQYERYRQRARIPIRPPLMQELFAQGILHRKEPQMTSLTY